MQHNNYSKFISSRKNGFGVNLYRNVKDKKLGGVCAGIGDHFDINHNIMRVIFVAAVIFSSSMAFWAYIIAWIVMVPKREGVDDSNQYEYDEQERRYRKKQMFRYRENAGERLRRANMRMKETLARVEAMEQYVTSKKFSLNRQFADLER